MKEKTFGFIIVSSIIFGFFISCFSYNTRTGVVEFSSSSSIGESDAAIRKK